LRIKIAKIDHVDGHEPSLSRPNKSGRAQYRLADLALTP
jgi:hypothetical protein